MSEETGKRLKKVASELYEGNQSRMARDMGMTPQAANKYFQGDRDPGFKLLKRLVSIDVNANWVLEGMPPMLLSDLHSTDITQVNAVSAPDAKKYFKSIEEEEDLSPAERRLLEEVTQFSAFLRKKNLNPYVKRTLLEQLVESIGQVIEPPPHDQDDS